MFELRDHAVTYGVYAVLMACLAAAAFGGFADMPFDTDDFDYIQDARSVLDEPSRLFAPENRLPGRPTIDILFAATYALWGNDPTSYHLLLIGLHLIASLLLAYTLRRLGVSLELSLLAGLLFLLNVAHFRAVQWISCVAYPLALILGFVSILSLQRFLKSRKGYFLPLAAATLALAVGSHPASASFALFCIYRAWRQGRDARTIVISTGPLLLVAFAGIAFLHSAYPDAPQSAELITAPTIGLMFQNLLVLSGRLATGGQWLPLLSSSSLHWEWLLGAVVLTGLVVLILRRVQALDEWAVWTIVAILPFVSRDMVGLSRHLYFASAGFSILLAFLIAEVARKCGYLTWLPGRRCILVAMSTTVATCATLALQRSEAIAYYYSGRAYAARGEQKEALSYFKKAVAVDAKLVPEDGYKRIAVSGFLFGESTALLLEEGLLHYPQSPTIEVFLGINEFLNEDLRAWQRGERWVYGALENAKDRGRLQQHAAIAFNHLGIHFRGVGEFERAAGLHVQALRLRPTYSKALLALNQALEAQGKSKEAIQICREAVRLNPRDAIALHEFGRLLARSGHRTEALATLEKALDLDATRPWSWFVACQLQRLTGDPVSAHTKILEAIRLDPLQEIFWTEYFNVGIDYHRKGVLEEALTIYGEVAKKMPRNAMVHHNLGVLHYSQERWGDAVASFSRAVELEPENSDAHLLLGQAYERGGRTTEAIRSYERTLALNPDSLSAKENLLALL